jgi:[methyl-Co(III) methanol-specific corrinoid protein]:coenzyme M methyltransferase
MDERSFTARERFVRALHGERVDRAPVANPTSIVTLELQRKAGVYFPQAHYEAEPMAELALAGHTLCGYDMVAPAFGAGTQESAALDAGIDIIAPECAVPVTAPLANVVAIPEAVIDYHAHR